MQNPKFSFENLKGGVSKKDWFKNCVSDFVKNIITDWNKKKKRDGKPKTEERIDIYSENLDVKSKIRLVVQSSISETNSALI